jgi:hypothetical protein
MYEPTRLVICKARAGKDGSDGATYFEVTEIKEEFP